MKPGHEDMAPAKWESDATAGPLTLSVLLTFIFFRSVYLAIGLVMGLAIGWYKWGVPSLHLVMDQPSDLEG